MDWKGVVEMGGVPAGAAIAFLFVLCFGYLIKAREQGKAKEAEAKHEAGRKDIEKSHLREVVRLESKVNEANKLAERSAELVRKLEQQLRSAEDARDKYKMRLDESDVGGI